MAIDTVQEAQVWPTNELGELVFDVGYGSTNIAGQIGSNFVPVNTKTGKVAVVIPYSIPYTNPLGLSWLNDTINGIDLYAGGFILRPTIYFDPSATAATSLGYGTLQNPYYTQSQLETVCSGNMAGEVLGIKRGTTFRTTGPGLTLTVYGAAGKPFTICPYGDAKELPIITGGAIETNWTLVDATLNIWSVPMPGDEMPCFQAGVRLAKKAYVANPSNSLTTNGTAAFQSGVLYIRPFGGVDPRTGTMEIAKTPTPFRVFCSNVAATGYIRVCGIKFMMGYQGAAELGSIDFSNVTTISDLMFTACSATNCGADGLVVTGSGDAFIVYGASTTKRATGVVVQGCYASDIANNAVEFSFTSGAKVVKNISYDCGGNSILELWSDNDNCTVQYNIGELSRSRYMAQYSMGGIWFAGNKTVSGSVSIDTTNTLNFNNSASFNLIIAPQSKGFAVGGGKGHSFRNNTIILDDDRCNADIQAGEGATYWLTDGTAATGFCDISNNLFYSKASIYTRYLTLCSFRTGNGAAKSNATGDKNIYCPSNAGNYVFGKTNLSFTAWKAALLAASVAMDQNSLLYAPETSAPLKRAQLGFNETTYRPLKTMAAGLTTLTVGSRYYDGQPYQPSTATIGALNGY